jgi:hypothetical protein
MLNIKHFRRDVVRPVLMYLEPEIPYSLAAENLLVATAMHESQLTHLKQLGDGPARGLFQMEPATEHDNWENFLRYNRSLADKVKALSGIRAFDLIANIPYQVAQARIKYWRSPESLPAATDIEGQAELWKLVYNSPLGKGTVAQFIEHYPRGL